MGAHCLHWEIRRFQATVGLAIEFIDTLTNSRLLKELKFLGATCAQGYITKGTLFVSEAYFQDSDCLHCMCQFI